MRNHHTYIDLSLLSHTSQSWLAIAADAVHSVMALYVVMFLVAGLLFT